LCFTPTKISITGYKKCVGEMTNYFWCDFIFKTILRVVKTKFFHFQIPTHFIFPQNWNAFHFVYKLVALCATSFSFNFYKWLKFAIATFRVRNFENHFDLNQHNFARLKLVTFQELEFFSKNVIFAFCFWKKAARFGKLGGDYLQIRA